jgi:hypothetical protein
VPDGDGSRMEEREEPKEKTVLRKYAKFAPQ